LLRFQYPEYLSSLTTEIFTDAAQQQAIPVHIEVTHAPKNIWRAVLVVALSLAFSAPAKANNLDNAGRNIVIGIVAVTAAVAVVVPL
jgi:hypothetical protein